MTATATSSSAGAKHTPGPWSVHGDHKTMIGCDDRKMMLAEVLYEHVCTEWGRPIVEAQANARLIAAAPELLVALEATRNFPWVHNAGITNDIEALRRICLAYADWANSTRATLLAKVKGLPDPNASAGAKR